MYGFLRCHWLSMLPVIWLDIQGQTYTLVVGPAAKLKTPVLSLCLQPSWVPLSTPSPGPGTRLPFPCTVQVGLKGLVLWVVASTRQHQQWAVQACPITWTPPHWPCCSSTTTSLTSEVSKHTETETWSNTDGGQHTRIISCCQTFLGTSQKLSVWKGTQNTPKAGHFSKCPLLILDFKIHKNL